MFNIALQGTRKPSKAYIMRTIGVCIEAGHTHFELSWGENWLEFVKAESDRWYGAGWIKDIAASDLAHEINQLQKEAENA